MVNINPFQNTPYVHEVRLVHVVGFGGNGLQG